MDEDRQPDTGIRQTTRHRVLLILFGVSGVIELWLWRVGQANQYGFYIGLACVFGAILSALQYIKYRKKV